MNGVDFYPLVEDPYRQGQIAAANVLSDVYASGVTVIDNVLMILGVSLDMDPQHRQIVCKHMIAGFVETVVDRAKSSVTGGQTVLNPWPIIGGIAMSAVRAAGVPSVQSAKPGDILVLTKPLGSQCAVNAYQWLRGQDEGKKEKLASILSDRAVQAAYDTAELFMCELNDRAAKVAFAELKTCTAATDVTGFGPIGHAANLASHQVEGVDFVLNVLPVFQGMAAVNEVIFDFGLLKGLSAETSGGLLLAFPSQAAASHFQARYAATVSVLAQSEEEAQLLSASWIVGHVVEGTGKAVMAASATVVEVALLREPLPSP